MLLIFSKDLLKPYVLYILSKIEPHYFCLFLTLKIKTYKLQWLYIQVKLLRYLNYYYHFLQSGRYWAMNIWIWHKINWAFHLNSATIWITLNSDVVTLKSMYWKHLSHSWHFLVTQWHLDLPYCEWGKWRCLCNLPQGYR